MTYVKVRMTKETRVKNDELGNNRYLLGFGLRHSFVIRILTHWLENQSRQQTVRKRLA